jgi:hypothetical protein
MIQNFVLEQWRKFYEIRIRRTFKNQKNDAFHSIDDAFLISEFNRENDLIDDQRTQKEMYTKREFSLSVECDERNHNHQYSQNANTWS